jgi:4-hydroxy-3-methylbut-2-en-1-yl diphosphate synthase IspG/GcpE
MQEIKTRNDFGSLVQGFYKTGIGAEIGVEYGSFSRQILSQWKGTLISVDMWADAKIEAHARKILNTGRSIIVKDSSVNAALRVPDRSLDFVYIDADHNYENCAADLWPG